MKFKRLLIRPDARIYPNRQDYLLKLSEANGFLGIADLAKILGVTYSMLVSMSADEMNALLAGGPLDIFSGRKRTLSSYLLSLNAWSSSSRVCPLCAAENKPQPLCFNLPIPTICPEHLVVPIDHCSSCGKGLSYFRRFSTRCDCGSSLTSPLAGTKPQWLSGLYGAFAPWHLSRSADVQLTHDSRGDFSAAKAITFLLAGKLEPRANVYIKNSAFPDLSEIVYGWPHSLNGLIERILERQGMPDAVRALRSVGDACAGLKSALENNPYYQDVLERYDKRKSRRTDVVGVSHLRKIAKLDAKSARDLLSEWNAFSEPFDAKGHGGNAALDKLNNLSRMFEDNLSIVKAAEWLGCDVPLVRVLAEKNMIKARFISVKPRSPLFPPSELRAWMEMLVSLSVPLQQSANNFVQLSGFPAKSKKGNLIKAWEKVMNHALSGHAPLYRYGDIPKMFNFFVERSVLENCGYPLHRIKPMEGR